jgi:hypothetical protein
MADNNEELLDYEEDDQQQQAQNDRARIQVSPLGRLVLVEQQQETRPISITAHYVSRLIEQAHPSKMLKDVIITHLQQEIRDALPEHQLAWSYNPQLKPQVLNARAVMTAASSVAELTDRLQQYTCMCHSFPLRFRIPLQDKALQQHCPGVLGTFHVRTTDLQIVTHKPLRDMLAKGLNHIPVATATQQDITEVNLSVAQQFLTRVVQPTAVRLGILIEEKAWDNVQRSVCAWTSYHLKQQQQFESFDEFSPHCKQELQELQQQLYICEVDKAASSCCFMCPQYAQLMVLLRLQNSEDFEQVAQQPQQIATHLQQQLQTIATPFPQLINTHELPIMRTAFKAHKDDYRFLTNASGSMLTSLNELAQQVTSCVKEGVEGSLALLNSSISSFVGAETQTCLVVNNAQEVALNMPPTISHDTCADITKCYEAIPTAKDHQDGLPAAMNWGVQTAFDHKAAEMGGSVVIKVELTRAGIKASWQKAPRSSSSNNSSSIARLTAEQVTELLDLVVSNAYVTAGGLVYRQTKGIPMGANYSPDACNLYFMKYEAAAVKRMCRLAADNETRQRLCREYKYFFRMMDDIRLINAPTLAGYVKHPDRPGDKNVIGWIYPPCVGIDMTHDVTPSAETQSTQYLDMLTHIKADGSYTVEVYDKQKKLPFEPAKYIALDSNRLVANSYKLVIGQASRIVAICSTAQAAAKHVGYVMVDMQHRGFSHPRLRRTLEKWAAFNNTIPGKCFTMDDVLAAVRCRHRLRHQ